MTAEAGTVNDMNLQQPGDVWADGVFTLGRGLPDECPSRQEGVSGRDLSEFRESLYVIRNSSRAHLVIVLL